MSPVTGAEANRVLQTRSFPASLNQGATTPSTQTGKTSTTQTLSAARVGGDANALGPSSIAELARSLRNNPDLIYQYIRNNIEYYPTFGVQKGALGAVLDNQGTAYDQAALMVELLRASGFTANYVRGVIKITAAQMTEWYGIDTSNVCGVLGLIGQAQIPIYGFNATSTGSCPGLSAAMTDVSLEHLWVKVNIGGTNYVFDPSYKPHTFKTGIDLASASTTGYNAATYLSSATSGATVTADYVQNINRTNIRNNLTTYANNLANYLRANKPAATLDDVIGGKTITPLYAALRQTALPYQDTTHATTELTDIPTAYKPTLRVQYQGIDQTYTSDAIYGKRLSITYNASNQPVLKLDGVAVGSPGTAATPGTSTTINFTVTHNAYTATFANHSFSQQIKAGGTNTFLIANGWGPAGRGVAQKFQTAANDLRASGAADASEPLLGSTLAVIGAQWIAQLTQVGHVTERLADTTLLQQHQVGVVGYTTAAYVDLPSNVVAVANTAANADKEGAAFQTWAMHLSILESTAVQQTTTVSAVSTVKLIDMASAAGQKIYNANGTVNAVADAKNNVTVYTYDGFDRLQRTYFPAPATPGMGNANDYEENTYDANGNVTAMAYQIGTRNASTMLRLRDGETQVLAGLLKDEQNNSSAGIPGLGAVPGVGRLFSNQTNTNGRSEIVLLITPRIVRAMPTPPAHVVEFPSGTADNASVRPMRLTPGGQYSGSAAESTQGASMATGAPEALLGSDPPAGLALPQQIEGQR